MGAYFNILNILHVISFPAAGGAEIYVKDLAKELVEQGHEVHIGFLGRANDIGRSVEFEAGFLNDLELSGVKYFFIGNEARRMPWVGAWRVHKYVKTNKIDVYHSHLTYGIAFGCVLKIPRFYTHHSIAMRIHRNAFCALNSCIDQLVGISDSCSAVLAKFSNSDVVTILNGVDTKKFRQSDLRPRRLKDVVRCVSVGRLCAEKNYRLLVTAISLLPSEIKSRIELKIAGEGSLQDVKALDCQISDAGLDGVIQLIGNVENVPALLAESDLFLMSSESEGLPIVLIEAAIAGLPCVVTDAGACREVIETCQNGVVVELGNAKGLAEGISRLIEEADLFATYSRNALAHSARFSIDRAALKHVELYEMLLQANRASF